jgi:ABC-2 type transport system ATP-binding protein
VNGQSVITTSNLGRRFGRIEALRGLDLEVPRGAVFGYLGRNGSGKSTTIRLLLGLIRPHSGSAAVLGHDPWTEPVALRRRIGYVAEGQQMYGWMSVQETIRFTAGFYPTWDADLVERFRERFELPPPVKVRTLSKGQNARLALLLALGPRPDLLILDDPTMGLDPISRQEFLGDIVRAIQEEGRTVFFSTHILQELEQVADWVGILDRGRLLACGPVDELKAGVQRYELTFEGEAPGRVEIDGLLRLRSDGRDLVLTARGEPEVIRRRLLASLHPRHLEVHPLSLDEIFAEIVLGGGDGGAPYVPVPAETPAEAGDSGGPGRE